LSIYLLKRITDDIRRERHMQVIEMQANRLEKLVNDLFTMSRLDQSITGEFNFAPLDMNDVLNEVLIAHDPLVQVKQHTLQFEPGAAIPATFGDPFQLDRLFTNLLINAVNYTPDGGQIVVRTRYHDGEIIAEMQDNGIGIAAEEHERIFNRFYRADPARSSELGGMGVGLSIARKIVEAHGGRIELESAPGKGSTFRVLLPERHKSS
jgi:two-component system phosphate regulon sensor histidine kinase PhoR